MLYSIIPPVLVVASLAGIIFFLVKNSSKLEELAQSETEKEAGFAAEKTEKKFFDSEKAGKFFLAVLEKIASKARIVFLKLETKFSAWCGIIRNKRMNGFGARKAQNIPAGGAEAEKTAMFEKFKELAAEKKKNEAAKSGAEDSEKEIRPMVSERMVSPKKAEIKNRVEELLIERIAVNPKDIEAYERLGEYYFEIKSLGDSKECFKQVIKLDPKNRTAKYRMRRLENLLAKR